MFSGAVIAAMVFAVNTQSRIRLGWHVGRAPSPTLLTSAAVGVKPGFRVTTPPPGLPSFARPSSRAGSASAWSFRFCDQRSAAAFFLRVRIVRVRIICFSPRFGPSTSNRSKLVQTGQKPVQRPISANSPKIRRAVRPATGFLFVVRCPALGGISNAARRRQSERRRARSRGIRSPACPLPCFPACRFSESAFPLKSKGRILGRFDF